MDYDPRKWDDLYAEDRIADDSPRVVVVLFAGDCADQTISAHKSTSVCGPLIKRIGPHTGAGLCAELFGFRPSERRFYTCSSAVGSHILFKVEMTDI